MCTGIAHRIVKKIGIRVIEKRLFIGIRDIRKFPVSTFAVIVQAAPVHKEPALSLTRETISAMSCSRTVTFGTVFLKNIMTVYTMIHIMISAIIPTGFITGIALGYAVFLRTASSVRAVFDSVRICPILTVDNAVLVTLQLLVDTLSANAVFFCTCLGIIAGHIRTYLIIFVLTILTALQMTNECPFLIENIHTACRPFLTHGLFGRIAIQSVSGAPAVYT